MGKSTNHRKKNEKRNQTAKKEKKKKKRQVYRVRISILTGTAFAMLYPLSCGELAMKGEQMLR